MALEDVTIIGDLKQIGSETVKLDDSARASCGNEFSVTPNESLAYVLAILKLHSYRSKNWLLEIMTELRLETIPRDYPPP